jgi:hypothetical protein
VAFGAFFDAASGVVVSAAWGVAVSAVVVWLVGVLVCDALACDAVGEVAEGCEGAGYAGAHFLVAVLACGVHGYMLPSAARHAGQVIWSLLMVSWYALLNWSVTPQKATL